MNCKQCLFAFAGIAALVWAPAPAFAQAGGGGVPDLSDFAGAIAKSVEAPPKVKATPAGGVFKSGLEVPSVKPGQTARGIGKQLRETIEKGSGSPQPAAAQLEKEMPGMLTQLEAALVKAGFAKRDMGVALAYTFIDLYETGTNQTVPEKPSTIAAKVLATAFAKHWGPNFAKLKPEAKEQIYESLILSTTLNTAFAQQFEKAGKTKEAADMRKTSADLFEKLIGVPPSQVKIGPDGRISGLADAAPQETPQEPQQ